MTSENPHEDFIHTQNASGNQLFATEIKNPSTVDKSYCDDRAENNILRIGNKDQAQNNFVESPIAFNNNTLYKESKIDKIARNLSKQQASDSNDFFITKTLIKSIPKVERGNDLNSLYETNENSSINFELNQEINVDISYADLLDKVSEDLNKTFNDPHRLESVNVGCISTKGKIYVWENDASEASKIEHKKQDIDIPINFDKDKPHMCAVCGKGFNAPAVLKRHIMCHTSYKPYVCDICGKTFSEKGQLKSHHVVHTGDKPFACDICELTFARKSKLKLHYIVHTGEKKKHQCDVCGRGFHILGHLQDHLRTHTGEKPFRCEVCGDVFSRSANLRRHFMKHKKTSVIPCPVCGKEFAQVDHMEDHKAEIHSGDQPYTCDMCFKCYADSDSLKEHYNFHKIDKHYKCATCGKEFNRSDSLTMHLMNHTGDVRHRCEVCGKGFNKSGNYKRHCALHEAAKPTGTLHACHLCRQQFSREGNLKNHMLKSHSESLKDRD